MLCLAVVPLRKECSAKIRECRGNIVEALPASCDDQRLPQIDLGVFEIPGLHHDLSKIAQSKHLRLLVIVGLRKRGDFLKTDAGFVEPACFDIEVAEVIQRDHQTSMIINLTPQDDTP